MRKLREMLVNTADQYPLGKGYGTPTVGRGGTYLQWTFLKRTIIYVKLGPNMPMGPHGGGWRWKIGIQRGARSWVFLLKTARLEITEL